MKFIVNKSTDPYFNLALEEWVFENKTDDNYFMLWRNDNAIIVGRNQNTIEEINTAYVEANNIKVVRRMPGGGAVYHDLGNVNFSFFASTDDEAEIDFKILTQPIVDSLNKLGVPASLSGRNDIVINGKKCAGLSQRLGDGRVLSNGAMLFDTDLAVLANALRVNEKKFQSKGIKSIRSRVTNIKPYLKNNMGVEEFMEVIRDEVLRGFVDVSFYELTDSQLKEVENLRDNKYASWDWNYGKSLPSTFRSSAYIDGVGLIEVNIGLDHGLVANFKVYGDFFGKADIINFENLFIGSHFSYREFEKIINNTDIKNYLGNISNEEFLNLIFAN